MSDNSLYKKLRIVFLCLAIVCMILSITKRAKAESMAPALQEWCKNYMDTYIIDYNVDDFNLAVSECPYFGAFSFVTRNGSYRIYVLDFYNVPHVGMTWSNSQWWDDNFSSYYGGIVRSWQSSSGKYYNVVTDNTTTIENNFVGYRFTSGSTDKQFYGSCKLVSNTNVVEHLVHNGGFDNYMVPTTNEGTLLHGNTNNWTSNSDPGFEYYGSYGDVYLAYNGRQARHYDNSIEPITNSTLHFNVFTYNDMGTDTVRFVPYKLITVGSHHTNTPDLTFDIVIDNTVIPCHYTASSGFYYESIEYNTAYFQIPFYDLLPSTLDEFNNVYITNVTYINTWSNPGENGVDTFYYIDKCYLKETFDTDDYSQVDITHHSTDTGYTSQEIADIYSMINQASTLSGTFSSEKNLEGGSSSPYSFLQFQDAVVREIECWHPTGTKITDWVALTIDNITYDSGDNMYWLEYDSNNTSSFEHRYNYNISPYSYIRENNYSGYYDIIYFIVHEQVYDSSGSGFSTLSNSYTRYYYFISDRYYTKLMLYREMDIMAYIKLNNECQEKIYDYLYYKVDNIDDNLYNFIKDKLNIDNDIVNALRSFDNDYQVGNLNIIDVLNRILSALSSLHLSQLDAIDTKLTNILNAMPSGSSQNEIDTVPECIEFYKSHTNDSGLPTLYVYQNDMFSIWFTGKVHDYMDNDDTNVQNERNNIIVSIFNTLTAGYDSIFNLSNAGDYIMEYIDTISGSVNHNTSRSTYLTHFFDNSFDINTYSGWVSGDD